MSHAGHVELRRRSNDTFRRGRYDLLTGVTVRFTVSHYLTLTLTPNLNPNPIPKP